MMNEATGNKCLLVGVDGLRPDIVSEELTPNLAGFVKSGLQCINSRSVYPSETYPNIASLITGSAPRTHGVVANAFLVPEVDREHAWTGSDIDLVESANTAFGGRFHTAPTVGDILGDAGRNVWSISTGSAGSARLTHPTVDRYANHLCVIVKNLPRSRPEGAANMVEAVAGPPPETDRPETALEQQTYATDAFLGLAAQRGVPDLAIVWYSGADHVMHAVGLGAAETHEMIRRIDTEFGRLLEWWRAHPEHERIQIVVCSDHGHVTQIEKVDLPAALAEAGFKVGTTLAQGADLVLDSCYGWSGNIRVRDRDPGLQEAVCRAMMEMPGMGLIFTRGHDGIEGRVEGTFAQSLVALDHPSRVADIDFCFHAEDRLDSFGYRGVSWSGNGKPIGASNHGGFHAKSMHTLLAFGGAALRERAVSALPAGIADIAPTLLRVLGVGSPVPTGRVLEEAWSEEADPGEPQARRWTVGAGGYEQELSADQLGNRTYFREGRRVS